MKGRDGRCIEKGGAIGIFGTDNIGSHCHCSGGSGSAAGESSDVDGGLGEDGAVWGGVGAVTSKGGAAGGNHSR